jgi:DNA-directed RNA polymerase subunit RPC12/RpoP
MMSSYPLSRCPACKKSFWMEIEISNTLSPTLGLLACPHCGVNFQRFDPQHLKGPSSQAAA